MAQKARYNNDMHEEAEHLGVPGTKKDFIIYGVIVFAVSSVLFWLLGNAHQALAASIVIAIMVGTLMFWRFRVAIAFAGLVVLLSTKTIDLEHAIEFMQLDVIVFLIGMMVLISLLRETGFFSWLGITIVKLAGFNAKRVMALFLFMAATSAALVDEVTSILFTTAMVLDFCNRYKISPVNYVISIVLATNVGSSWTVLGNPVGIMIALRAGLTFENFMRWAFPPGFLALLALILVIWWWQRRDLQELQKKMEAYGDPFTLGVALGAWADVKDKAFFWKGTLLFITVILLLALHYRLELLLGLEKNTLLIAASIGGAAVVMFWKRERARQYLEKGVDWWTLTFFMFLFSAAGAMKYVGVSERIAEALKDVVGTNPISLSAVVLWVSAFTSAALDNVVVVAAFIPVIQALRTAGAQVFPLWWALLFGGTYGGNITMVGSTANVVALGILEKQAGYHMTLRKWIGIGLIAGVVPALIGILWLLIQLPLMP
jgi:Na+/H+ antiporter NhaD/arsenite permease-like protein